MGKSKVQTLYFDIETSSGSKTYGFSATELAGVDAACPFGTFPGLPSGVLGLALWNGRLYPVLDLSPLFGEEYREQVMRSIRVGRAVFLFSGDSAAKDVAIALPTHLHVREEPQAELLTINAICDALEGLNVDKAA